MILSALNHHRPLIILSEHSRSKTTVMVVDTRVRLMTKAGQMDEELSLFLLSITMKGTTLKVKSMEEAELLCIMVV